MVDGVGRCVAWQRSLRGHGSLLLVPAPVVADAQEITLEAPVALRCEVTVDPAQLARGALTTLLAPIVVVVGRGRRWPLLPRLVRRRRAVTPTRSRGASRWTRRDGAIATTAAVRGVGPGEQLASAG